MQKVYGGVTLVRGKGREQGWVEEAIRPQCRQDISASPLGSTRHPCQTSHMLGLVLSQCTAVLPSSCLGLPLRRVTWADKLKRALQECIPGDCLPTRLRRPRGQCFLEWGSELSLVLLHGAIFPSPCAGLCVSCKDGFG